MIFQALVRRSCDVLDALPMGETKRVFLPLNFALPFCHFPTRCRLTIGYEAAPEGAKSFPFVPKRSH